jgi:hypothetical protein
MCHKTAEIADECKIPGFIRYGVGGVEVIIKKFP